MDNTTLDLRVRQLYRAATGETGWAEPLDGLCADFGAHAVSLQTLDLRNDTVLGLCRSGQALAEETLDYVRQWQRVDPRRRQTLLSPQVVAAGQWVHSDRWFIGQRASQQSFFRHFLPAYDIHHSAHLAIAVDQHLVTGFAVEMPAQHLGLSGEDRAWLERLGHHLRDALRAHERLRRLLAPSLVGWQLMEAMTSPMWLLGEGGRARFANRAARQEQQRAACIDVRQCRLRLVHQGDDHVLQEQLRRLLASAHGTRSVCTLSAPEAALCRLCLQTVTSAGSLAAFADGGETTVMAVLLDPARVSAVDPHALATVFDLTPAEARVAALLAQGQSASTIATTLGVLESTVRSHVRQVLAKFGVPRTIDVVRVLAQSGWMWRGLSRPDRSG